MRTTLTESIARAAAQDAGNRNMRKAGRSIWSREDYNEAVREFNRLWGQNKMRARNKRMMSAWPWVCMTAVMLLSCIGGPALAQDCPSVEWISIDGGVFRRGSNSWASDEKPVHSVILSDFEIARTEVTVNQYKVCVDAGACTKPGTGGSCNWDLKGEGNHPVNCVDWAQAKTYSEWAGGRLCTEAEWEYAARSGGKDRKYPWSDEEATCTRAVMDDGDGNGCSKGDTTWEVCAKPEGNTDQGVCDMAGNVWEWVSDWYGSYPSGKVMNPGGPWTGPGRVTRGGSWYSNTKRLRTTYRNGNGPANRNDTLGFRPCRSR